jgi:hypothetical protein
MYDHECRVGEHQMKNEMAVYVTSWVRQEMHVTFWLGNLKRKKSLEEA